MKTYTIERRMINVKTGWFKRERKPMWCLVKHGSWTDSWFDVRDYHSVILQSEDKDYIEQELNNFRGDMK